MKGVHALNVDNRGGVHAAVDHLAGLGHRRFGFVGKSRLIDVRERVAAFVERLTDLGMPPRDEHMLDASNDPASGADAFSRLAATREPPTAVITATDHVAIGVLHAARRLGISVPGQVSVVGFDDIHLSSYTAPPLTTLHNPVAEMASARRRPRPRPPRRRRHRPRARPGARRARVDRPTTGLGRRAPVLLSRSFRAE